MLLVVSLHFGSVMTDVSHAFVVFPSEVLQSRKKVVPFDDKLRKDFL